MIGEHTRDKFFVGMNFSDYLKMAIQNNGLSFRQIESQSAGLDHAYIYRLAKGDKTSPSEETVKKLAKALRMTNRELNVLRLLSQQEIDDPLVDVMLSRPDLSWDTLECAATMSNRGKRPANQEEWLTYIKKIERFFDD